MPLRKDDPKSVGGYRLLDRLGAGGMGAVYRGRSRSGREVAVKVVHAQYAENPVFRTRFRQEIAAVRKVSGVFTAPVVDADPDAERPWMATQYVPGPSLAARIRDEGPLNRTELRRLALGLVEALRDIHRAGVVHRDLKPANVLMADDGPRVIDFGISRAAENHNTLTETGQMIGTPPFMSPEQLTDARSVGPASDVFSLGALIVFAATGRGPFDADSPYLTAYQVVHDAPALDDVPDALRPVLARCLAKDPKERPEPGSLAAEFMAALPESGDGEPSTVRLRAGELALVRTRPTGTPDSGFGPDASSASEPPARRRGRARRLWAVSGTAVALALGLTAYLLSGPGDDGRPKGTNAAAPSRWAAPPDGWRPWQTTVEAPAATGVKRAYDVAGVGVFHAPRCAVEGNAVFCAGDGTLPLRIDALTGRAVWRADGVPSAADKGEFGFSVLGVVDGTVVVQQQYRADEDGEYRTSVTALDARTGKLLWHRGLNDSRTRAHLLGDLVAVPDDAGGRTLVARSPRTGAERWTAALPEGQYCDWAGSGTDVPLVCGPGDDPAEHRVLLSLDATDGTTNTAEVPYDSVPVGSFDGRVLLLDRSEDQESDAYVRIRLVDTRTGRSTTTRLAHALEGDVTLADGVLWCASSSGRLTAVSARTGARLWTTRTSLEQPSGVTHDPRARVVYLATASGRVAALDATKGTPLWETLPRARRAENLGRESSQVLLHDGALVVSTSEGGLFSLNPAHPDREPVPG
ncbi:protein kinase domain-containing protein [Streptomyces pseudogriseolus]|uniref:Serine/threonine protein kinase n=1 Tax=Streptomyces pseudogriseolus TaxID=36817 RepID=A0ABQ2T349_STREZ|nr:serine/threonine-protein kinase [Streptomyces rubiginosus]GGS50389.1 serine/threonine protein kinase [Streptomyces rubiginosus]